MTRDAIDTAVREGIPFAINMADGKSHEVREATKIAGWKDARRGARRSRSAAHSADADDDDRD